MEYNFGQLFPSLVTRIDPAKLNLTTDDLESNSFFSDLFEEIVSKYEQTQIQNKSSKKKKEQPSYLKDITQFYEAKTLISKVYTKIVPVKISKGTVIYTVGMTPDQGYFLVHGCVELLSKKNSWQKLQSFVGHTCMKIEQRMQYLESNYKIDMHHFDVLQNLFYEEKMFFNFLPFHTIYSKGYFGFRQMSRGSLRTKLAVAVEDCILLKISKHDFEKHLKQFEQKRQKYIMECILANAKAQIAEEVFPKLSMAFNSAQLISVDRENTIIKQYQFTRGMFFLLKGQVIVSKDVKIQVPKKYLTNENKGQFIKQMVVKLHKIANNTFIGDIEPLLSIKNRQFTFEASVNSTVLIKFDSAAFVKSISQSILFQRQITLAAKYKYSTMMDVYTRSKSQIIRSYFNQFQELDHRKKQKNITSLLTNEGTFKQNELYELFKKEGVFYRDSFQRLEGFQQFESKYDPKRSTINRHKVNSISEISPSSNKVRNGKEINRTQQITPINENEMSLQAAKKMLLSPGKLINPFQMINSQILSKIAPKTEHNQLLRGHSSSTLRKKKKTFSKFQELRKDQNVYKKVLIQNGLFEKDRSTSKGNMVQAIVNHKFDEVVKQCMTRKNHGLRKALIQHRDDIIKNQFIRTVSSLPNRSTSLSTFGNTSYGFTCKGTDEMRKKLEKFKYTRKYIPYENQKTPIQTEGLEQCIGFNQKPLSSDIRIRPTFFPQSKSVNRSPEKIVLINHMMKPITYTSNQI